MVWYYRICSELGGRAMSVRKNQRRPRKANVFNDRDWTQRNLARCTTIVIPLDEVDAEEMTYGTEDAVNSSLDRKRRRERAKQRDATQDTPP